MTGGNLGNSGLQHRSICFYHSCLATEPVKQAMCTMVKPWIKAADGAISGEEQRVDVHAGHYGTYIALTAVQNLYIILCSALSRNLRYL